MGSQKELILKYLRAHGSITPMDAINHCNHCYRLSARIWDLRAEGHNIITDDNDSAGNPVNYAIYRLKEDNVCSIT